MKIVTWNINSIRLRLSLLQKLVETHKPDIIALQETKVQNHLFPAAELRQMGYDYLFYAGQKSYNGVAIISKKNFSNSFSLDLYNEDKRHVAINIGGIEIHNFYVPAGGDIPDIQQNPKFKHKLEYINLMENWLIANRNTNNKLIIIGDLNIAPNEHDVWSSKQLRNIVSHTEIERAILKKLQASLNFIDSARHFVPLEQKLYTWWSYRNIDWQKSNRGRRLDHIWVSKNLQSNMLSVTSLSEARSWQQPSDHVPYMLTLSLPS